MQKDLASIALIDRFFKDNMVQFFDEADFNGFVKKSLEDSSSEPTKSKYIIDIGKVFKTLNLWEEQFPSVGLVYKASSNMDELMIKLLNNRNVKFTTFSGVEIERLVSMGVDPRDVYFSALCKINRHIRIAEQLGVDMLTFCSESELRRIATCHPKATLCLRLANIGEVIDFDVEYVSYLLGMAASLEMKVTSLQVNLEDIVDDENLELLFEKLHFIIFSMKILSVDFEKVFIGSTSFFSTYKFGSKIICDLSERFRVLTQTFNDIEFFAESGDMLLNSGTQLLCTVAGVKIMEFPESEEKELFYYLNDGVYGSFGSIVYRESTPSPVIFKKASNENSARTTDASLWGPTCDSIDKICSVKNFPVLEIGDVIAFDIMGAGCRSSATTFNGFTTPDVEYVVSYQCLDYLGVSEYSHSRNNLI